jgi:hypothetical protein
MIRIVAGSFDGTIGIADFERDLLYVKQTNSKKNITNDISNSNIINNNNNNTSLPKNNEE